MESIKLNLNNLSLIANIDCFIHLRFEKATEMYNDMIAKDPSNSVCYETIDNSHDRLNFEVGTKHKVYPIAEKSILKLVKLPSLLLKCYKIPKV